MIVLCCRCQSSATRWKLMTYRFLSALSLRDDIWFHPWCELRLLRHFTRGGLIHMREALLSIQVTYIRILQCTWRNHLAATWSSYECHHPSIRWRPVAYRSLTGCPKEISHPHIRSSLLIDFLWSHLWELPMGPFVGWASSTTALHYLRNPNLMRNPFFSTQPAHFFIRQRTWCQRSATSQSSRGCYHSTANGLVLEQ